MPDRFESPAFLNEDSMARRKGRVAAYADEIEPGMHVADYRVRWWDHLFLGVSGHVNSPDDALKVKALGPNAIVHLDPALGILPERLRPPARPASGENPQNAPEVSPDQAFANAIKARSAKRPAAPVSKTPADYKSRALRLSLAAGEAVRSVLREAADNKSFSLSQTHDLCHSLLELAGACPDALVSLAPDPRNPAAGEILRPAKTASILASLGLKQNLPENSIVGLIEGALLLDVGNASVPASILQKPGRLSAEEFAVARSHVQAGISALERSKAPEEALILVAQHHERFAGNGYPNGLSASQIDPLAQTAAAADAFCALTSPRPWRRAASPASAIRTLWSLADKEFSRQSVEDLVRCIGIYPTGTLVLLDCEQIAVVTEQTGEPLLPVVYAFRDSRDNMPCKPRHINLAKLEGRIKILSCESFERWHADPSKILIL